jgi:hypothetical protein
MRITGEGMRCKVGLLTTEGTEEHRGELPLSWSKEVSDPDSDLNRVHPRVRRRQTSIRDMHVAQFQADVIARSQHMHSQCGLVHEVHRVRSRWNIVVGENHTAREFQKWGEIAAALEIPFQPERVEADAVRRVRTLEDQEHGDRIYGVLETSAKKSWQVLVGEDPSVA